MLVAPGGDTVDAIVVSVDGWCGRDVYRYHLVPLSGERVCIQVGTHFKRFIGWIWAVMKEMRDEYLNVDDLYYRTVRGTSHPTVNTSDRPVIPPVAHTSSPHGHTHTVDHNTISHTFCTGTHPCTHTPSRTSAAGPATPVQRQSDMTAVSVGETRDPGVPGVSVGRTSPSATHAFVNQCSESFPIQNRRAHVHRRLFLLRCVDSGERPLVRYHRLSCSEL